MRALRFHAPDRVELVEVPKPVPADGEALVRIEASAICGSELHAAPGSNPGHEAAGIVERAPKDSGFALGERVGISAVTGCGVCDHCRRGVQLWCRRGWHVATGLHADYAAAPISALRRAPPGTSARDVALISGDALGVPARALRRVPSRPGQRVLVLGLGPIGLGHTLVRAHTGSHVVAIEPSSYRRDLALALGAAEVLAPGEDLASPPSLVIECTGIPAVVQEAFDAVDVGGTVLQSGECARVELSPSDTFVRREVTYTGSWYYADEDWPEMRRLYEDGLQIARLVTHELPADQVAEAYRAFSSTRSGKVVLHWTDDP